MPSVKMPKKSTATDMTPFVDVSFLILFFFIMATKFKPPAPLTITTPHSVSSDKLKEQDAILIEFDSKGVVYFTMNTKKPNEAGRLDLIKNVNETMKLGLSDPQMASFAKSSTVGSPFSSLKSLLSLPLDKRADAKQPGIPVDSTDNQLAVWISGAVNAFQGTALTYMIKGDNEANYPTFKGIIDALRKNEQYKYQLITDPESAPSNSELYRMRAARANK